MTVSNKADWIIDESDKLQNNGTRSGNTLSSRYVREKIGTSHSDIIVSLKISKYHGFGTRIRLAAEKIETRKRARSIQAKEMYSDVKEKRRKKYPDGFFKDEEKRIALLRLFIEEYKADHKGEYPGRKDFASV